MEIQQELIQKVKGLYEVVEDQPNLLVYGYVGSLSKGFSDSYSDLDIVVIFSKDPNVNKILNNIKKITSEVECFVSEGGKMNFHFRYNGTTATLGFKVLKEINSDLLKLRNNFSLDIYKRLYSMRDFEAVYGDKKMVKKIKLSIPTRIPESYIKKELKELYQWVVNNLRKDGRLDVELKRKNYISINYRLNRTLAWVIQLIYLINGLPFQDARWIHKELLKMRLKPNNCLERLNKIVNLGSGEKDVRKKITIFRKFVYELDDIIQRNYTGILSVRKELR